MGCTEATEHKIEVTDPKPFKERLRNIPSGLLEEVKYHLDHMLDVGVIKPSKLAWSNAIVLVQKRDGGLRFCINFQRLNAQTRKDAFPLPQIHNAIHALSGSKYYTTVDLCMPFRLFNIIATFQRLMTNCLGELNFLTCLVYLDDIVIYFSTKENHIKSLQAVPKCFRFHGIKL